MPDDYEGDDSDVAPLRALFTRRGVSPVASGGGLGDLFNKAKPPWEKEASRSSASYLRNPAGSIGDVDTSLSLQANIERFKSRLTSPECIAVLNHKTFAEYIASSAVIGRAANLLPAENSRLARDLKKHES